LFLDGLDQTFLEFSIMHGQDRLPSVEIDPKVRAFAGFEDSSLSREPALKLLALHRLIINNIVYADKCRSSPVLIRAGSAFDAPAISLVAPAALCG
jgi:hypothetical protein